MADGMPGREGPTRAGSPVPRRKALRIAAFSGAAMVMGGGLIRALMRNAELRRIEESRTLIGTVVTITVVHPDGAAARAMVASAFSEIERLDGILSRHRDGTPVHMLNTQGRIDRAPPELITVLNRAREISEASDGAFDITVAPVLELYRTWFESESSPPPDALLRRTLSTVDYRQVQVEGSSVRLAPGMAITLDGIAKGYVVDRTVAVLEGVGADRVLVNAGGDMASSGAASPAERWRVGIQDPHDPGGLASVLLLAGESVATSGDYHRAFTEDRSFHHIVDPRTGRSPDGASSATVVASRAMDADAASTTALVLGPLDGVSLLERLDGVEGVIVAKSGDTVWTKGMDRFVTAD